MDHIFKKGSRPHRVVVWLAENEGWHRGRDVATALDLTTHQANVALHSLYRRGVIERKKDGRMGVYATAHTPGGDS